MANPNLVRKPALDASTTGEVSKGDILTTGLSGQNYVINGHMVISQRGNSFVSPVSGTYLLDRWAWSRSSTATHTVSPDSDVPTFAQAGYNFTKSMRLNLTLADTSIAAGDYVGFFQRIEGYNWAQIAQKSFTLSFWVKATTTGTYCVSFFNQGEDRTYVAEYTINTTNTWEYKTITVPAAPTAGSWNYDTGTGITVNWMLACGSTLQTTANAWQTGSFRATANQVNGVNTGSTDFRITGIMLNEGTAAATFSTFGKTHDQEYAACQRYYEITTVCGIPDGSNGAIINITGPFCVAKRAIPSCSSIGTIAHINGGGGAFTFVTQSSFGPNALYVVINNGSALSQDFHYRGTAEANAEL